MKIFYLYVEPYTFLRTESNMVLIYNTLSQEGYMCKSSDKLKKIIDDLLSINNKYCIEISELQMEDNIVSGFITLLRKTFSGDLIDKKYCNKKPFSLLPVLKLKMPTEVLKEYGVFIEDNALSNFQQLTLYLNGNCNSTCSYCETAYKQFVCCTKNNNEFTKSDIIKIANDIVKHKVKIINIVGGNLLIYPYLKTILEKTNVIQTKVNVYFHYTNFKGKSESLENLRNFDNADKITYKIYLDSYAKDEIIKYIIHVLKNMNLNFELVFIVENENDYINADKFCELNNISVWDIKPLFTNDNYEFFEENVFLTEKEILQTKLQKSEVFANQILNTFDFGKLTVLSDKSVYSNVNNDKIGLYNSDLTSLIYKEFLNGNSWFKFRNNEICNNCVLKLLCPSPSNYELAIGKPNLCHVKP